MLTSIPGISLVALLAFELVRRSLLDRCCRPEARDSVGLGSSFISVSSVSSGVFGKRRGKMHIPRIRDKIKRKVPAAARDANNGKRMATPLKQIGKC